MKVPLDNDLDKAYESFNQNHDRLREAFKLSLQGHPKEDGRTPVATCIGSTITKSTIVKLAAAAVIVVVVAVGLMPWLPGREPTNLKLSAEVELPYTLARRKVHLTATWSQPPSRWLWINFQPAKSWPLARSMMRELG
ncbi:MAG: hypothetical protein ACYSTF_09915 [Planctomycetota bacterium]